MQDMILKAKGNSKAIVLVVDYHTAKILSSCLRMYDVMEAGVLVLENVLLTRERLELPAIYFVQPTPAVIEAIIRDYDNLDPAGKKPAKPAYSASHLFFTSRLPADLMKRLSLSKPTIGRIKTLIELNSDFIALESHVFTFDKRGTIPNLYFPPATNTLSLELSDLSRHLVSLCLTMHEYPYVRYVEGSGLSVGLAKFFHEEMATTISKLPEWKYSEQRERGTLLIIDRSMDVTAPLMHEYTFQAMVNDLLKVHGELCYLPGDATAPTAVRPTVSTANEVKDEAEAANALVLSEDDPLWVDFRHRHIGDVMAAVTERFKEFKSKNKLAKLQSDDSASVKDMIQAMKDMPEYKSMMKKYHKHMSLAQECMSRFAQKKLKDLGELEQDIATGLTNDGKAVNQKLLLKQMQEMCVQPQVGPLDRLRLVMIYLTSMGALDPAIQRDLLAGVSPALQRAIQHLPKLGVDATATTAHSKERMAEFALRNKTIPLALMRYVPVLHHVIEQSVQYSLDEDRYPYVTPPPEEQRANMQAKVGRSARRKPGQAGAAAVGNDWKREEKDAGGVPGADRRPRFLIFVIGGLTFSEMRSAYEIAEQHKANVYIGSSNTCNSSEFIVELSGLRREEFKSALQSSLRGGERMPDEFVGSEERDGDTVSPGQVQIDIRQPHA